MGAVSLAQESDGYTVWWVAFGSAEVFQGGNGEILLGVALMPGKKLMFGIRRRARDLTGQI